MERMLILCLLLGAILGVILFEVEGFLPGLLLGYLVYQSQTLRKQVDTLTNQVDVLNDRLRRVVLPDAPQQPEQVVDFKEEPVFVDPEPARSTEDFEEDVLERAHEKIEADEIPEPEPVVDQGNPPPEVVFRTEKTDSLQADAGSASIFDGIRSFLLHGNWLLRAGIAILFIGLSFFVNWAIENELFPLELRLTLVGFVGAAMVYLGSRLVNKRPEYGFVMEGGGLAVLYLTIFASYRLYGLLSEPIATGLLMAVTLFGVLLGLAQNAQWVAVVSMLGGFMVPVLISNDEGSHVALFSYYAILNMGILITAFYKPWRYLNLTGFLCTFGVATAWGGLFYKPEFFASTEPFLLLFFAIYLCIGILYTLRHEGSIKHAVDGTLVFGLPIVVFALQASLVEPTPYGISISCALLGLCYLGAAQWLRSRKSEKVRLLIESFDGVGIALFSLFIPFLFDTMWTGIGWAIEGAALVWLGMRQQRVLVRVSGYLLVIGASLVFMFGYVDVSGWGYAVLSLALFFTAYQVYRHQEQLLSIEQFISPVTMYAGLFFWLIGGGMEIVEKFTWRKSIHGWLLFSGMTALLCTFVGRRLSWSPLIRSSLFNVPVLGILVLASSIDSHPFFGSWGALAWLGTLSATYASLYLLESHLSQPRLGQVHAVYLWILAFLGSIEVAWYTAEIVERDSAWPLIGGMLIPVGCVMLVSWATGKVWWPFEPHKKGYLRLGAIPIIVMVGLISIGGSFENTGDGIFAPYVPLFNPLDVFLIGFALVCMYWYGRVNKEGIELGQILRRSVLVWGLVGLMFIWMNATIARTIHHWMDVPYNDGALWESSVFQATLSICWTLLAVTTMAIVARRGIRTTWIVAASLLAIVVLKLLVVDLSTLSTLPRIISFIGVGVLMLIIGYIAPVPPRQVETEVAPESP